MTGAPASLYHGVVSHQRLRPVGHRFSYRVFSMLIDLDRIDELAGKLRFFSRNRFNLFSFFDRDHCDQSSAPVAHSIRTLLRNNGFAAPDRILLLCYPRIVGYVFNPLSVYYCYSSDGRLFASIYEVRNTFGEKHFYLIAADAAASSIQQSADKAFFVSPFMEMNQRYEFSLNHPGKNLFLTIRQSDPEGPIFHASVSGIRGDMTDQTLIAAFLQYPLMTLKVIAAIHWEAARLFAKGLKIKKRRKSLGVGVTVIRDIKARPRAA